MCPSLLVPFQRVAVYGAARSNTVASLTEVRAEWGAANDTECAVVDYMVAVGHGPDSVTVLPYTSVGLATRARLGNLTLRHGQRYVLTLVALNGAGLSGRATATFLVDTTAPLPGEVYLQGYTTGGACQAPGGPAVTFVASPDNVTVCASGFEDPESGARWALAIFVADTELVPWHAIPQEGHGAGAPGLAVALRAFNVTFLPGLPHTVALRATNPAGLSRFGRSAPFYLDTTPPVVMWFLFGTAAAQVPAPRHLPLPRFSVSLAFRPPRPLPPLPPPSSSLPTHIPSLSALRWTGAF